MIGLKSTSTKVVLRNKIESGLCEMKEFKVKRNGRVCVVPHYRIIDENPENS